MSFLPSRSGDKRRVGRFPVSTCFRRGRLFLAVLLIILLSSCIGIQKASAFSFSLVHLNDTHSHLEPAMINLTIDQVKTATQIGGFARIKTVLNEMRREDADLLLLHAGDAVQGTLYFALFNGTVEYDLLNLLDIDAMAFGNHEFDRGTGPIPGWITRSRFPWLSANIDFSGEPTIGSMVKPWLIKEIHGEKVAVIGVTTETTPQTTLNVGNTQFRDAVASTVRQIETLTALGINKIILLSHLGYWQDQALAAQVSGIDVIVGGHSHTLLGDAGKLKSIGLTPEGPYPTAIKSPDGKPVLIVQAWQWGHMIGRIRVRFTPDGDVAGYDAMPVIPIGDHFVRHNVPVQKESEPYRLIRRALENSGAARIVLEDPELKQRLAPYARQVAAYRLEVVCKAVDDLPRGLNSGPGPLAADSMIAAAPGAEVALLNYGGVRKDMLAGAISVGDVLEVLPFGNTLVMVDLTGEELKNAIEEGIEFLLQRYPAQTTPAMPYLGGAEFSVQLKAPMGRRVSALVIRDKDGLYQPVHPSRSYRTIVNTFVAGGGDGFASIKNSKGYRYDTGIIDSDAFRDSIEKTGAVRNPTRQRIKLLP